MVTGCTVLKTVEVCDRCIWFINIMVYVLLIFCLNAPDAEDLGIGLAALFFTKVFHVGMKATEVWALSESFTETTQS